MKLYYFPIAPNPTKVLIYVREKGLEIDMQLVDLRRGEHKSSEHLARNPRGNLPVLEVEEGQYLTESLAIIEYLEECYPEPAMIGRTPLERARIRAFERQVETGVLNPLTRFVHSTNSPLGLPARPEIAEAEWARLLDALPLVDASIGESPFAAGETPTIVDCTLFAALHFGDTFGVSIPEEFSNMKRWHLQFSERPSAGIQVPLLE